MHQVHRSASSLPITYDDLPLLQLPPHLKLMKSILEVLQHHGTAI